ncbi:hypothetical protein ILUMI_19165, partial [Ignelater luminosus]
MTTLKQIQIQILQTLIRDKSLPELIEVVKLGQSELSHFSIESMMFLPELKEIEIFDSTITKLSYEEYNDSLLNTTNSDKTDGSNKLVKIEKYTFAQCTVEQLMLFSNAIILIEPFAFRDLNISLLSLRDNLLTIIEKNTFSESSIRELDLGGNKIEVIEPYAFSGVKDLFKLSLDSNKIAKIDRNVFPFSTLKVLDVSNTNISLSDADYEQLLSLEK